MTANVATALTGTPTSGSVGLYAGGSVLTGTVDAGEDVLAEAGTTVTMAGGSAGDDFTIIAAGAVNVTGDITTTGTGVDLFEITTPGAPGTPGSIVFVAETMPGSNISITSTGGSIKTEALTAQDNITTNSATTTMTGVLTANGLIDLAAGGLANIDDLANAPGANNVADDVFTIAGINSGGGISLTASSGDIILSGPVSSGGLVDLNTPNGDLVTDIVTTTSAAGIVVITALWKLIRLSI